MPLLVATRLVARQLFSLFLLAGILPNMSLSPRGWRVDYSISVDEEVESLALEATKCICCIIEQLEALVLTWTKLRENLLKWLVLLVSFYFTISYCAKRFDNMYRCTIVQTMQRNIPHIISTLATLNKKVYK